MSQWMVVRDDELYHHGIKGQKWGIRRYQNEDGSLTPEGEKRYGTVENFEKAQKRKKIARNIAIGVGAAAAVGGGIALAANASKNRRIDTERARNKMNFLGGREALSKRENRLLDRDDFRNKKRLFKENARRMSFDQASAAYDKTLNIMNNKNTDKNKMRELKQWKKELGAQVGKKSISAIMRNIGSVPLSAARDAAGDKGRTFMSNLGSSFWRTPVTKIATGIGNAVGSAVVGYAVKRMKDRTREDYDDEEWASYMWQNPNKK